MLETELIMGLINPIFKHFPVVSLHLKMVTNDVLGHDKFNWEVLKFIFSCSG